MLFRSTFNLMFPCYFFRHCSLCVAVLNITVSIVYVGLWLPDEHKTLDIIFVMSSGTASNTATKYWGQHRLNVIGLMDTLLYCLVLLTVVTGPF